MSRELTCEERIDGHMKSRLEDFRALTELSAVYDEDSLRAVLRTSSDARDLYEEIKPDDFEEIWSDAGFEELNENARQRLYEYPLGVSTQTVFRVELSTGGPGDWLEVLCSGDTPRYEHAAANHENYEIQRIVYHFNDWFDHAERELNDEEFKIAEAFVSAVVPELVE